MAELPEPNSTIEIGTTDSDDDDDPPPLVMKKIPEMSHKQLLTKVNFF